MKIFVKKGKLIDTKSQAMILPLLEGGKKLTGLALEIDKLSGGLISEVTDNGDFEAKASQVSVIYTGGNLPAKRLALVGLGKQKELNLEKIRSAFSSVMKHLRNINVKEASTSINLNLIPGKKNQIVEAAVEGALLGLYRYTPFKTVDREDLKDMEEFHIIADAGEYSLVESAVKKAKIITDSVYFARDLISAPANEMTPTMMAQKALDIAGRKNISCKVLDKRKMKEMGMNALLAVASGSHQEPKFIILEYTGRKKAAPIVLVGKGLTFDSGGISIKPAEKMDEMKSDMSGGAAVMAVVMAAADLQLPLNITALVPATENLPGGSAYKPGDIIKSYSGKTIEVLNTDAEGRLILADALAYASSEFKPEAIIDIATLTGACVIALGDDVIGMLGTDEKLKKEIDKAAQHTGELVWELPLWDSYHELIKSDIADYKNSGGRPAGTITAAAFLSKFVGEYPWVHLDIAGPAWTSKDKSYIPKGAAGVAVRLLVEFLRNRVRK